MTIETEDVVRELRSWPALAITQGDALSARTVALLMEKAADLIQSQSERIAVLEGALEEALPFVEGYEPYNSRFAQSQEIALANIRASLTKAD